MSKPNIYNVIATGSTTPRDIRDRFSDIINVKDFGAVGDGIHDDTTSIQLAVNASVGKLLIIPAGKYKIAGTGIQIPSNVTINLDPNSCMYQSGYYRYDRETAGSYVPANVVDYNIFWMDNGVENVTIYGGRFYGPFYRENGDYSEQDDSDYNSSRAVENWPASNGIAVRGDDYYVTRKGLPYCTKRSKNITLTGGHYEGWAEEAIQLDQVDNSKVMSNTITRCGRGGVRLYGCHNAWIMFNNISYIYPGDYFNGGNRMYGVTATKVYKPGSTYSDDVWIAYNHVYHVPYWKSLDTHGGRRIRFLYNDCRESHIGIGVDKGGESSRNGYFPPKDITIVGNYLLRTLPDSQYEGNATDYGPEYGEAGDGITLFAGQRQDGVNTDLLFGKTAHIYDNTLIGWGGNNSRGALSISNWHNVHEHDNSIQNSRRCALYISNESEGRFGNGDIIDDVRRTTAGIQLGMTVNPVTIDSTVLGKCNTYIDGITFINRQDTDLTCINLPVSADGYNNVCGNNFSYKNYGSGNTIKYTNTISNSSIDSPIRSQVFAQARINIDGTVYSSIFNFGIQSSSKTSTGTYTITLNNPSLNKYTIIPLVSGVSQGLLINAIATDESTLSITTYRNNTLEDSGFNIVVLGY